MTSGRGSRGGQADIASLGISVGLPGHRIGNVIWEGDWTWVEGVTNIGGYPSSDYFAASGADAVGDYTMSAALYRVCGGVMPDAFDKERLGGRCISPLYPIPSTLSIPGEPSLANVKFRKAPPAEYTPDTRYTGMGYHYPPIWIINPGHVLGYYDTILRMSYWLAFWKWVRDGGGDMPPEPVVGTSTMHLMSRDGGLEIDAGMLYAEENAAARPLAYMFGEIASWDNLDGGTGKDGPFAPVDFARLFRNANAHYSYRTIVNSFRQAIEQLAIDAGVMKGWKRVVIQGGGDDTGGKPEHNRLYKFGNHPFCWLNGCGWRSFIIDHAILPLSIREARKLIVNGDPYSWHDGWKENTFEYRSLTETLSVLNVVPCNIVYAKGIIVNNRDIFNTDSPSRWYSAGGSCQINITLHVVNHSQEKADIAVTGKLRAIRGEFPNVQGKIVPGSVTYLEEEPGEDTVQAAISAALLNWKAGCATANVRRLHPFDRATYIECGIEATTNYSYDPGYWGIDGGDKIVNMDGVFWTNLEGGCNVNPWEGPMEYEYWDAELHPFWPYVEGFGWVYWKSAVHITWTQHIDAVDIGEDIWPAASEMNIDQTLTLYPGMNTIIVRAIISSVDKGWPATSRLYEGDNRMTPRGLPQYIPNLRTSRVDDVEFSFDLGGLFKVEGKCDGQAGVSDYQEIGRGAPPEIVAELSGGV